MKLRAAAAGRIGMNGLKELTRIEVGVQHSSGVIYSKTTEAS